MNEQEGTRSWQAFLNFPLGRRLEKPRQQGLTMIIDKGLGLMETKDILNVCGQYIDFFKLGFGTPALYAPEVLEEKIHLVRSFDIEIYPGGTFFEVAILQDKIEEYLYLARSIGFTAVEVSDGTINLPSELREKVISRAADLGLKVLTEVGKKNGKHYPVQYLVEQIRRDLELGAYRVILEGRESGTNAGLYNSQGEFIHEELEELLDSIGDPRILIWEAPLKNQQEELILRFGPNVNLGNIPPHEVLALEALRVGLRADTLKSVL
ncbi:phosphosulfolactate synthase [Desulfofundulus australicus DSM 11792]|uniref:Phosphosulfolactate synthase n=1 Tax=Desulfofundulus australicus DSM 11792 TaxID=1121425 RepID=A0A1M5DL07_9FIRM|nr:phosphosulfolactate synthase [Desulfofundulus australicus]SHF67581.1 phosphosulfolactate synthase [Desulfofundulus australicus DSM 11792]